MAEVILQEVWTRQIMPQVKIKTTMPKIQPILIIVGLGIMGCTHNTKAEAMSNTELNGYESVVDSIIEHKTKVPHLDSEYFLYDITGDGIPELWIKLGTCEADTKLLAFTLDNENVSKIYDGDGGHSDYFIFENHLVSVMCNTGAGVVVTYGYDGKSVIDTGVEFSTWNDEGKALSEPHDSLADAKLNYWEDNYGNYIELKPL